MWILSLLFSVIVVIVVINLLLLFISLVAELSLWSISSWRRVDREHEKIDARLNVILHICQFSACIINSNQFSDNVCDNRCRYYIK